MDNHGNLKFFSHMDGNSFISVRMAPLKVMTSANMPVSTKDLAARNKALDNGPYNAVPEMVLL